MSSSTPLSQFCVPFSFSSSIPLFLSLSIKVRRNTDRVKSRASKYMGSSTPSLLLSLSFPSKSVEIRTGSIRGLLNTWVRAPPLFFFLSLFLCPLLFFFLSLFLCPPVKERGVGAGAALKCHLIMASISVCSLHISLFFL